MIYYRKNSKDGDLPAHQYNTHNHLRKTIASLVLSRSRVTVLHSLGPVDTSIGQVKTKTGLAVLVDRTTTSNLLQTVAHEKFIVSGGEDGGGHVDENRNPAVVFVGEGFGAEEDGGDEAGTEISGKVGGDGDVGETAR